MDFITNSWEWIPKFALTPSMPRWFAAARMESNGTRDCIHVSQSTADELIALGKGHWVNARKGKITAKGTFVVAWAVMAADSLCMTRCKARTSSPLMFVLSTNSRQRTATDLLGSAYRRNRIYCEYPDKRSHQYWWYNRRWYHSRWIGRCWPPRYRNR